MRRTRAATDWKERVRVDFSDGDAGLKARVDFSN
jgi:hypothetical protein